MDPFGNYSGIQESILAIPISYLLTTPTPVAAKLVWLTSSTVVPTKDGSLTPPQPVMGRKIAIKVTDTALNSYVDSTAVDTPVANATAEKLTAALTTGTAPATILTAVPIKYVANYVAGTTTFGAADIDKVFEANINKSNMYRYSRR